MNRADLIEHLELLKTMPVNEVNIKRMSEVTTAILNVDKVNNFVDKPEEAVLDNMNESEDLFSFYMKAKRKFHEEKSNQNNMLVSESLKVLLLNINETIEEIWSLCDTQEEKDIIRKYTCIFKDKTTS